MYLISRVNDGYSELIYLFSFAVLHLLAHKMRTEEEEDMAREEQ